MVLEFCNVTRSYGNNKGIKNNSWKIERKGIVGFVGHNGCGKTTTLKIIAGLQIVDSGEVKYLKKRINSYSRKIIGLICEHRNIYQDIKVYQQLKLICELQKVPKKEIESGIDRWLLVFGLLEYKYKKINELSKGNQQLMQIICGLIHEPEIILLDEPFNGLDSTRINKLVQILKELSSNRIIVVAFHQLELKESLCSRIIQLENGMIVNDEDVV
jgi:ABC-type uncharacterized transport system, ATPase component